MVEHLTRNEDVSGSTPLGGSRRLSILYLKGRRELKITAKVKSSGVHGSTDEREVRFRDECGVHPVFTIR